MYVRKKTIKGREYYYLVKSVRRGDTIRQVYLEYLGSEPPSKKAVEAAKKEHQTK